MSCDTLLGNVKNIVRNLTKNGGIIVRKSPILMQFSVNSQCTVSQQKLCPIAIAQNQSYGTVQSHKKCDLYCYWFSNFWGHN